MTTAIDISVVIPVFNSEENLVELNRRIGEALKDMSHEVIYVNDCSTDGSWKVIQSLCNNSDNISGVSFRRNFGQDNALMSGIASSKGNYIVIMDDDLQHDPADIPELYNKCSEGFDVCYARFRKLKQSWWKRVGSSINDSIANMLLKKPRHIYMSPFKIINGEVAREMLQYTGPFPYVDGLLLNLTSSLAEIEATHHPRFKGKGNYTFMRSLGVTLRLAMNSSVKPLRIAAYTGFVIALLGFGLAAFYLIEYFFLKRTPEGWTSLIISTLIIGGLVLATLGVVGEYLSRIYLGVNKRPQYSVKEKAGQ